MRVARSARARQMPLTSDRAQEEFSMLKVSMLKVLLTVSAAIALLAAGSVASSAQQIRANDYQKRVTRHHRVTQHPSRDITSFSSSSVLHVGVNHPPKNK
jgi:hypothetical protein